MTNQEKPSAAEQIKNLNDQLTSARGEAYEAKVVFDLAEERIKAIKNALSGAQLGHEFAEDNAKAEAAVPKAEVPTEH